MFREHFLNQSFNWVMSNVLYNIHSIRNYLADNTMRLKATAMRTSLYTCGARVLTSSNCLAIPIS